MSFTSEELGFFGGVIGALSFVARGLIKLLDNKGKEQQTTINDITSCVSDLDKKLDDICEMLDTHTEYDERILESLKLLDIISINIKEILRMHRDPNSVFATEETNRLLNRLITASVEIREALRRTE